MFDFNPIHLYICIALIAGIVFRKAIYEFFFARNALLKELVEILPFVDPDSNRMVEIVTFKRNLKRLHTDARYFDISANIKGITIEDIIAILQPYFTDEPAYKSKYLFRAMAIGKKPVVPVLYAIVEFNYSQRRVNLFGEPALLDEIEAKLKDRFIEPHSIEIQQVLGVGQNGFMIEGSTVYQDKIKKAFDAFYPFIEGGVEKLARDFNNDSANALVFIGPWGTGKTTLIRHMMFLMEKSAYGLVNSTMALQDQGLVPWIKSLGDNAMVVTEDSDQLLVARENGNTQMASLLNQLDGVIPTSTKVIISTNLENGVNRIEPALLRGGRTANMIQFRALTLVEANAARAAIDLEPIDDVPTAEYSLGDALTWKNDESYRTPVKTFGLIPQN